MGLILIAIGLGNAAYQSGNITGAYLGLEIFLELPTWKLGPFQVQSGNLLMGLLAHFFYGLEITNVWKWSWWVWYSSCPSPFLLLQH